MNMWPTKEPCETVGAFGKFNKSITTKQCFFLKKQMTVHLQHLQASPTSPTVITPIRVVFNAKPQLGLESQLLEQSGH